MSRLTTALENDFNALCFLRDELALQFNLLEADLKVRWSELETKFERLREKVGRAEVAAGQSRKETEAAARLLVDSLRSGYSEIKRALGV